MAVLEPIEDRNFAQAIRLLVEGFPDRTAQFWCDGLHRALTYVAKDADWPLGFLLRRENDFAGVMLTFPSRFPRGTEQGVRVNLSSWYVQPDMRIAAPLMLKKVLDRQADVFTDLTPIGSVAQLLLQLDFSQSNEGYLLASWPQTVLARNSQSVVRPLRELPSDAFSSFDRRVLEDHEEMGCVSAGLYEGSAWTPLIFLRRRVRGVPSGYLLYARSRRQVIAHRRAITAFLTRRGMPLFVMDANRDERSPGCLFVEGRFKKLFRGQMPADQTDYTYSELTYLNLH